MHQVPLLISELSPIRPNFKLLKGNVNTRSSQAQPLYKIDKLVATGGAFQTWTVHFGVLLCLTVWKGARMFTDKILEFRV